MKVAFLAMLIFNCQPVSSTRATPLAAMNTVPQDRGPIFWLSGCFAIWVYEIFALGEFVHKYTVSVKVVDHDFKPNMLNLLNQTIRLVRATYAKGVNTVLIQVCIVGTCDVNFCILRLL
nr:hypothetical protein CFP56_17131 [Quercus suber]